MRPARSGNLLAAHAKRSNLTAIMKIVLVFAFLGMAMTGGMVWAVALNFGLPCILSVIGASMIVIGGLLAGLTADSCEE